jgi:RecB family exonuclease
MADKPDLFSRLFRKTQEHKKNIEQQGKPAANNGKPNNPPPANSPRTPVSSAAKSETGQTKIPLSGSKIELYQTCPRKFYFTWIRKTGKTGRQSAHLSFDQTLHAVLKSYYLEKTPDGQFRLDRLLSLLDQNWDSRGYESPEQQAEFRGTAQTALRNYFARYCQQPSRHLEVDYFFKVDLAGGEYSGKIDRVDRHPDGTLELIDYKTGKAPLGGASELEQSLSLQLLFLASESIWPGKVKKITLVYLKDDSSISIIRNQNEMAMAKKRYLDLGEAIYKGKFDPVRSAACNYCDFQELCPVGQIPALNAAKIRTFLDCPHKYASIYVRHLNPRADEVPSLDLAMDRPLHDALAQFHRDYRPTPNLSPETAMFSYLYKSIPTELPEELQDEIKNTGRELLQMYLKSFFPRSRTAMVNEFLEFNNESFCFQTTIDRVDKDNDGCYHLVDYKTGKRLQSVSDLSSDPVVAAICAAASNKWPGKIRTFSCLFLRHGEETKIEITDSLIRRGNQILKQIGDQIRQKNFEPLGGPVCSTCSVGGLCNEKRLVVSMSKIQTMRDCPRRYEFRYISKAPVPEKEKPAIVLYQLLQGMLHEYIASGKYVDTDILLEKASTRIAASNELSSASRSVVLDKAYKALHNINQTLQHGFPKTHSLGEQARTGYEDLVLTTRFDRIDILPNGNLHVIMYKTGKKSMTAHEARLDISGVYSWFIADRIYPGKIDMVSYIYLLTGDTVSFTPTQQDIEKLKLTFSEFVRENMEGSFEGQRNPLCSYCDYVEICDDAKSMLLSPSKINCFQSCALKYRLKYIDRIPRESRPTPNLSFDRSLHFALRDFHENYNARQFKKNPFRSILNKYWIKEGYSDVEEEERFKARANVMLEDYFKSLDGSENPVMFEVAAKWSWNGVDTVVQIDRIDQLPDGQLEIIDYKTGKKVPDERVINEDASLMNMYLAASQKWPGRVAKVSYHFLANNRRYSLEPQEKDIQAHQQKMAELVELINKNEFEARKGSLCAWCEFYGPCPEWKVKPHEMAGETPEQFRQRIRLSYSKMSLYLNCPRSYRKLYIDKVPPKPQPFFSFGTTIHETFERVYDPVYPIPKPSLERVLDIYDVVRMTDREGFDSDAVEEQYRQDGIRQITMYYNQFIKDAEFKPAYSIEDYFEIPCGKYAVMTGFIDRIDKLADGTYEILDYKTEPTMRTQEAVDNDKQLSIYYWACEDTLGLKISKLSLLMLDHDVKIETTRTRESIAKVVETIDKTAYEMIHEKEFTPRKNKYCKSCDHLHDCPLKGEILHDESLISMKKF